MNDKRSPVIVALLEAAQKIELAAQLISLEGSITRSEANSVAPHLARVLDRARDVQKNIGVKVAADQGFVVGGSAQMLDKRGAVCEVLEVLPPALHCTSLETFFGLPSYRVAPLLKNGAKGCDRYVSRLKPVEEGK
jgi:hypothetical protein